MRLLINRCLIALIAYMVTSNSVFCQSTKANYKKKVEEGNFLFLEKNYPKALETYLEAYAIDSTNANVNFKIGMCYLNSVSDKIKAVSFFEKASKNTARNYDPYDPFEKRAPENVMYYLGQVQLLNFEFDAANKNFQKFSKILGPNEDAQKELRKFIENCVVGKELTSKPSNVTIKNIGEKINTSFAEYCPIINADESVLLFTSRREGSTGGEIGADGKYNEDIYMCRKDGDSWSSPSPININTNNNDAAISLSANGNLLFVYKDVNGGDIYMSELSGDTWGDPMPLKTDETDLNDINTEAWETHACISADGNTLYFVSDRKGGFGGRDIYRSIKLPNGKWSKATNLGSTINTEYDEDAPFLHPDGVTLFYSSQGHRGMGGFDIFYSSRKEKEEKDKSTQWRWTTPVNMGSPINTPDDDVFYVLSTDGKRAYYSSAKVGGFGEKDLYQINVADVIVEPTVLLRGFITFDGKESNNANSKIIVADIETGQNISEIRPNSKTGKYLLILNPGQNGKTFAISYEAEGFQPYSETIKIEPGSAYQIIERTLDLRPVNLQSKNKGTVSVAGILKDKNGNVIPGAKITVKNNKTGEVVDTYYSNPTTGAYYMSLQKGENYNISFDAEGGYLYQSENLDIPKDNEHSEISFEVTLNKMEEGQKVILKNIFFDTGKATIKKESVAELEKLYKLLSENPDMAIEISGHTDGQGKPDMNLKLSEARAKAVADYLTSQKRKHYKIGAFYYKGINKNRITAKGYGSTLPIAGEKLADGKPDTKGMQLNRRVEFKVTSISK